MAPVSLGRFQISRHRARLEALLEETLEALGRAIQEDRSEEIESRRIAAAAIRDHLEVLQALSSLSSPAPIPAPVPTASAPTASPPEHRLGDERRPVLLVGSAHDFVAASPAALALSPGDSDSPPTACYRLLGRTAPCQPCVGDIAILSRQPSAGSVRSPAGRFVIEAELVEGPGPARVRETIHAVDSYR